MEKNIRRFAEFRASNYGKSLCLAFLMVLASCATSIPAPRPETAVSEVPFRARVVLMVPDSFDRFVYVDYRDGQEVRHRFGEEGTDRLVQLLRNYYSGVSVEQVGTESEAMDRVAMYRSGRGDYGEADLIAVPRFVRVEGWDRSMKYGMDIDLQMDFYSTRGTSVTQLRGHGESNYGAYATASPFEAGRVALDYAVSAIGDGINSNRDLRYP